MAQTTSPTSLDVLDGVNTAIASVLTTTQGMAGKIHEESARLAAHNTAQGAHGIGDATSPLRVSLSQIVAGSIAESTSVKDVQASIAKSAATLSDIEENQTHFSTACTWLEATVSGREQTLTALNRGITDAIKNVSDLRTDVENGAYGGGGGSPVSLPTLSGPDQIGIGLSADYTLFCIGSAIDGATIASFEVTFAGGTAQTVAAVNGMATATVTASEGTAEGTALTLSVVAIDSSGFRSREATKEVTAIQYVVQAPSLTTPAPGAYVSPASVIFATSPFAVVGPTDTHAASRFKLTSDVDGAVIVSDSGRTTTDLTTHTANLSAAKLAPGATYYAWAQHEGAALGVGSWSNPVTIVAAAVVTPKITSPSVGAEIASNNITVTTTTFAALGGITDTHASTDWRITSDTEGNTVIAEALASTDLTSHVFASPSVTRGQTYYLWARHRGTVCGAGAWAKVRVSIRTIRHGEILYDTSGQPAAVVTGSYTSNGAEPWTIRGKQVWIAVALASKRGVNRPWCTGTSTSSTGYDVDISTIENPGTNWKLASNNTAADGSGTYVSTQSTEAHMDASFTYSQTVKDSEGLTDAILAYNSSMQAAQFCRTITLADLGTMNFPSIDVLMRIYQARTLIDALDTTAAGAYMRQMTVGSLFSGVGLCALGLSWVGMRHAFFCEVDPFCRSVLRRHWLDVPIYEDVRDLRGVDLPPVDVLCGGFPCQDVSLAAAGKRKGITGKRSGLWNEYARLIKEIRPKYVIAENVPGLLADGIETVLRDLAALGYDAEWEVLSAAAVGAPHRRERFFLVAYLNGHEHDPEHGVLSTLAGSLGEGDQSCRMASWLGVRIDRACCASIREAYGGCVLRRVDDGSPARLDGPGSVKPLPRELVPVWHAG